MASRTQGDRLTLTVDEAATALGIGRGLAYEAVRRGEIPTIQLGRRLLVPRVALERLLAGGADPASGQQALVPSGRVRNVTPAE